MPDWVAHICISFIVVWILGKTKLDAHQEYFSIFILGSLMPDLERPFRYLFDFIFVTILDSGTLNNLSQSIVCSLFHTLIGVFIIAIFLTSFFPRDNSKNIFLAFVCGGVFHLLLDSIMWPWHGQGIQWFWPLPLRFSFHLVWPGDLSPLIISGIISLILIGIDLAVFKRFYIYDLSEKLTFKNQEISR